ncbi:MAG: ThuA domain-containing protein [Flavobacteriales bacterium TMED96]|nr:MAG: ThuA domain-containing protein [Flavobacteriales bacterium TMED96]
MYEKSNHIFIIIPLRVFGYKGISNIYNKFFKSRNNNIEENIKLNYKEDKDLSVLVYSAIGDYSHTDAIKAFNGEVKKLGLINNWGIQFSNDPRLFNTEDLKKFDVVIWNNSTGNTLNKSQMSSFENYIENGGGYVGIHGAGDNSKNWEWYYKVLLKAKFTHHPNGKYEFQNGTLEKKCNNSFTNCQRLPATWEREEEWYFFDESPQRNGSSIIYNLDEKSLLFGDINEDGITISKMGEDHPIVWTNCVGKGKAFYSAMGHKGKYFLEPLHMDLIKSGIIWASDKSAKCN